MKEIATKTENGMTMYFCETANKYFPETQTDEKLGITYRLDTETWTYNPDLPVTENKEYIELMKEPIGIYGQRWQEFMQEQHPEKILELQLNLRWAIIPRLIEREAQERLAVLEEEYQRKYPVPTDFWEKAKYYKTMQIENSSEIMREIVLQVRE